MTARFLKTVLLAGLVAVPLGLTTTSHTPSTEAQREAFDIVIAGGRLLDGTGAPARRADVGLRGDRIAAVGDLGAADARTRVDATGLVVAPGFINVLSWSTESLIADGRSQSEIRQGVTTQVMGEGWSMGPWSEEMKARHQALQEETRYEITWTTLAEYLQMLERKGISPNVASLVGATTVREHVVGLGDTPATPAQIERMQALVRHEMAQGALGLGSSLIYPPGFYASTEELIALCRVVAEFGGLYMSHLRSEGNRLIEAVEELLRIAREAGVAAEIYHLKAAGEANWPKMDRVIAMIEDARRAGLRVTANMYTYTAGATGLDASVPPWAQDGGFDAMIARLKDPAQRSRIAEAMRTPSDDWENLYLMAGSPDRVLLVGFRSAALEPLTGKTLGEVARARGRDPVETILDLLVEDHSSIGTVYFMMSEDNLRKQLRLPWVSFGSDAASMAPEGVFLKRAPHPRAYGNFARLLGRYVRDERVLPLEEAVRRLTSLPAETLGLKDRGRIVAGAFADLVVFDPATIADRATFERPHQYATGVRHVLVNGVPVLRDGEHTGALPGRALRRGQ